MKKQFILSVILMFFICNAFAQGLSLGVKGGAEMRQLSGSTFKETFAFGYHLGAFAEISLSKKVYVQPELYFSQVRFDTAKNFSEVYQLDNVKNVSFGYINIPVLLGIKMGKSLQLQAGPQFGILVNKSQKLINNAKEAFKTGEFSMAGGLQLSLSSLVIVGRYVVGLSEANGDIDVRSITNSSSWKSQSIHLGVGLKF